MSEITELDPGREGPSRNPNRIYIIIAAVLVVVIIVTTVLLITQGIPALTGKREPTATAEDEPAAIQVSTFTPGPTKEPTQTPAPLPSSTLSPLVMLDPDTPAFDLESSWARPGSEWTGFFGRVFDAAGDPVQGVLVIIWYRDGQPASSPTPTDQDGYYEIRLAEAPLAGLWTIQLLTPDGHPASRLFSFETDENTETGNQQFQNMWLQLP